MWLCSYNAKENKTVGILNKKNWKKTKQNKNKSNNNNKNAKVHFYGPVQGTSCARQLVRNLVKLSHEIFSVKGPTNCEYISQLQKKFKPDCQIKILYDLPTSPIQKTPKKPSLEECTTFPKNIKSLNSP